MRIHARFWACQTNCHRRPESWCCRLSHEALKRMQHLQRLLRLQPPPRNPKYRRRRRRGSVTDGTKWLRASMPNTGSESRCEGQTLPFGSRRSCVRLNVRLLRAALALLLRREPRSSGRGSFLDDRSTRVIRTPTRENVSSRLMREYYLYVEDGRIGMTENRLRLPRNAYGLELVATEQGLSVESNSPACTQSLGTFAWDDVKLFLARSPIADRKS